MSTLNITNRTLTGIPLGVRELQPTTGAYTAFAVSLIDLRKHIRAERKKHFPSSREAAKAAGLGASTVAKIENIKTYPAYDPGIGTLEQLLQAMSLTLSHFFLQIERQTNADLSNGPEADTTSPPTSPVTTGGSDVGADTSVLATDDDRRLLVRLSRILAVAATQIESTGKQASKARSRKPTGARRGGRNR